MTNGNSFHLRHFRAFNPVQIIENFRRGFGAARLQENGTLILSEMQLPYALCTHYELIRAWAKLKHS